MPVVQTVLIYVLVPGAIYGAIALLTLRPKYARVPRYRPGQPWTYEPVWWSATGAVDATHTHQLTESTGADTSVRTARGGCRGNW